jgi:hypothetical protein
LAPCIVAVTREQGVVKIKNSQPAALALHKIILSYLFARLEVFGGRPSLPSISGAGRKAP